MNISKVIIDKDTVLKFLGYKNRKVPPFINKVIDEEIESINEILDIEAHINEVDTLNHSFLGQYIDKCLKECEKSYAVVYTMGNKIEEKILHCTNNNDMIRGMVLDKIGIVALDFVGEEVKKYINKKNYPLKISNEIYPGDKDFEVKNQNHIYNYLNNTNISINEYGQMTPIKSVGLIICLSSKCKEAVSRCDKCLNKCF